MLLRGFLRSRDSFREREQPNPELFCCIVFFSTAFRLFRSNFADMADKQPQDENEKTIAEDLVVTKYKMAGDIVNSKFYFIYKLFVRDACYFYDIYFKMLGYSIWD